MQMQEKHRLQDKKISLTQANKIPKKTDKIMSKSKSKEQNLFELQHNDATSQSETKTWFTRRCILSTRRTKLRQDISLPCLFAGVCLLGVFFLSQKIWSFQSIKFRYSRHDANTETKEVNFDWFSAKSASIAVLFRRQPTLKQTA